MSQSKKEQFLHLIHQNLGDKQFVNVALMNKKQKNEELQKLLIKPFLIKGKLKLSIVFRYPTKDITKNFDVKEGIKIIGSHLEDYFIQGELHAKKHVHHLYYPSTGKSKLKSVELEKSQEINLSHDHQKTRSIDANQAFLFHLGIANKEGKILSAKQSKFRQINRFIELLDPSIESLSKKDKIDVVDLGSGKAYLSFALYNHFTSKQKNVQLTGVELREELVVKCNQIAKDLEYQNLNFVSSRIEEYTAENIDVLIALHACDTATDDAIAMGINNDAELIVCSPCCHKALRKQLKSSKQYPQINQFGILQERQAEILTDTIRALILQSHGYETKVIEFISSEHTSKNLMIIAQKKSNAKINEESEKLEDLKKLKDSFGIGEYYLEELLKK